MKAGSLSDFSNSMAAAIEAELGAAMAAIGRPMGDAPEEIEGRRVLCVAIARGVLRYLRDHDADIRVSFTVGSTNFNPPADITVSDL